MFVEPVGVLAIAAVGGPTTRLHVSHAICTRPQHSQERFWMHRARAHFRVVWLLQHAALLHPKMREAQNQILKRKPLFLILKFYFRFQFVSSISRANNLRSVCSSIQFKRVSRNSTKGPLSSGATEISSSFAENLAPNSLPGAEIGFIPTLRQSPQCKPSNKAD